MKQVDNHVEMTAREARSGLTGRHVLTILIVSVMAGAFAMSAFWTISNASH